MAESSIPGDDRARLLAVLGAISVIDLLATLGALQLLPENANALWRLEAAAGVATSAGPGDAQLSVDEVLTWVNREELEIEGGAFNSAFVDEILFHYGSFAVLPGLRSEAAFAFRMLAEALLRAADNLPADLFERARDLAAATLMIGDAVCRKAGLARAEEPAGREGDDVGVRDPAALAELEDRVSFDTAELTWWLRPLGVEALEPLVQTLPADAPGEERELMWPLWRPIFRGDDRYVVAGPHMLLPALVHALLEMVRTEGQADSASDRFAATLVWNVRRLLSYFAWPEIDVELPARHVGEAEWVFAIDTDKLAHALVVTERLGPVERDPALHWHVADAAAARVRFEEVRPLLDQLVPSPSEVLQLLIVQGFGEESAVEIDGGTDRTPRLALTAAELETIVYADGGDRLLLLNYAQARRRLLERAFVFGGGELDLFRVYRSRDDSFYISDDALPEGLDVSTGLGGELRRQVQNKRDFHGAPYFRRNSLIQVSLTQQIRAIPIYMPFPPPLPRGEPHGLLVEGYDIPVWIFAAADEGDLRVRYAQMIEAIAYWMWQFTPSLGEIVRSIGEQCSQLWLTVELERSDAWLGGRGALVQDERPPVETTADEACRLHIVIRPSLLARADSADNEGERELMRCVVGGLVQLEQAQTDRDEPLLGDAAIEAAVDRHAPLGIKKAIVIFEAAADLTLDPRDLPDVRHVQEHDNAVAMDELGEHLIEELGLPIGVIDKDERTRVLNESVAFHLGQIERLVASLSPNGVLEWLVTANDAHVVDYARMRLETPTKMACYGEIADVRNQLAERLPRASTSSIANRFLIEYVSARPPAGTALMSQATYDRLMAHASQIHARGYISDLIHFALDDPQVSILPSRRLGVSRETAFMAARDRYLGAFTSGEVARSVDSFPRLWRQSGDVERPARADEFDRAAQAEFGLTLTEIGNFLGAVANAGLQRDEEPTVVPLETLVEELAADLGWERERIEGALELHALRPRDAFMAPPAPYRKEDLYPWRFNRSLSYVRRPLVIRPSDEGDEAVFGTRQVAVTHRYFGDLVLDGRLKATSAEMRALIGRLHEEEGEQFNDAVADLYEQRAGLIVRRRVKKIGGVRLERAPGQEIGDVDVLVANVAARKVIVVETKDLAVARTPAELINELTETFESRAHGGAAIDRHQERIEWVRAHLDQTLEDLGIPEGERNMWEVEGLIVVDIELMSPYLTEPKIPIVPYRELEQQLGLGAVAAD